MIAFGIDPGLADLGWAIVRRVDHSPLPTRFWVQQSGTIVTRSTMPLAARLDVIRRHLEQPWRDAGGDDALIAVEGYAPGPRVTAHSMVSTACVVGFLLGVFLRAEIVMPQERRSALGLGRGEADVVHERMKELLGASCPPKTQTHRLDASAVAIVRLMKATGTMP